MQTNDVQDGEVSAPTNEEEGGDTNVAYRGSFHDQVVKAMAAVLRGADVLVETELMLCLVGTPVCTRADLVVEYMTDLAPSVIEVKTGASPTFTPNQAAVYPHLNEGGLVYSPNSRITTFGLTPGIPLPPIHGFLYYLPNATAKGVTIPF